jgi:hypothetical protein
MKVPGELSASYLKTAQDAWAYLAEHSPQLTNDGHENIVDDYCALMAATELVRATGDPQYRAAADRRQGVADPSLGLGGVGIESGRENRGAHVAVLARSIHDQSGIVIIPY